MKYRGTKALAMLLTLALVLGLMPGMGLTAYAAPTETLLTTITGAGSNTNPATSANVSYSTEGVATLTFSEPTSDGQVAYQASPAWGWWGYAITITVTPAEGYTITKCVFYDDANRTATDSEAPFIVETVWDDKTPKVNGAVINYSSKGIKKIEVYGYATPAHTHSFSYAAGTGDSANTITATCTAGCPDSYDTKGISLIISAPSNLVCDDSAKAATFSDYPSTAPTGLAAAPTSISYNPGGTAPTTPGTYTASFTWGGATASVSFTLTANAYAVTLSGGANATTSGGNTRQTVTAGNAMEPVIYTANSNYRFPETSAYYTTTNGITVARTSDTVVTVSGRPTADAAVTVPDVVSLPGITAVATGYDGPFDGQPHGIIVNVTDPTSGYEVKYGETQGSYTLSASPQYTAQGSYTVYYQVTAPGRLPLSGSASVNIAAPQPCTVKWLNWNNDVLQTGTVAWGTTPVYTGQTPTRPNENGYQYSFVGWSPEPEPVTQDTIYVAVFSAAPIQTTYKVSFAPNGGGGVMNPVEVPANTSYTLPACGFTPPAGMQFKAWMLGSTEFAPGDTIKVDSNAEFVAIWKDDDGSGESGHGGITGDIVFIGGGYGGADEWYDGGYAPQRAWKVKLAPMVNGSAALGIMTGESTTTEMNVYPTTTIYVFPNANPGFVLDKIIWSYIDGTASYDITESRNFVMPAMDVVVYVTFKPVG